MLKRNQRNHLISGYPCLGVIENWAQNGLENSGENLFPMKTSPTVEDREISEFIDIIRDSWRLAQHVGTAALSEF